MITDAGCVSRLDGTRRRLSRMVGPRISADVLSWRDPVRRPANARRLWTTPVGAIRSRLRRLRRHRLLSNVSEKRGVVKAESLPEVGTPPLDHREDTRRNRHTSTALRNPARYRVLPAPGKATSARRGRLTPPFRCQGASVPTMPYPLTSPPSRPY